ncbi:hypothetical protein [Mesorhizobium australicum]|uniref:hypothetical protein n=1 Tax=Mesorhizobium australicum TaxID=536018 RepID=UPI00333580EF
MEAQRAAVARFAEVEGIGIIQEFTEVETGKGSDALDRRPQLAAALALARQAKCPVGLTHCVAGRLIPLGAGPAWSWTLSASITR